MAESKKEKKELTVEEKLKALYKLQTVNSEIDKIKTLRGELPLEVQDLEDEIVGLNTRIANFKAEIAQNETNISGKKSVLYSRWGLLHPPSGGVPAQKGFFMVENGKTIAYFAEYNYIIIIQENSLCE